MQSVSIRCRLKSRMLPGLLFVVIVILITIQAVLGFSGNRDWDLLDMLDLLIRVVMAAVLFYLIVSGRKSLWTMSESTSGIRIEKDGSILFDGPFGDIQIIDEEKGVMTLRSADGSSFLFPRRRVFHAFLIKIATTQNQQMNKP